MKEDHISLPQFEVDRRELAAVFPGGFTVRDEANSLTAYAFRNGPLETLHAGKDSALLKDPTLSRITDAEMKELMINASRHLAFALHHRQHHRKAYDRFVRGYGLAYCGSWVR